MRGVEERVVAQRADGAARTVRTHDELAEAALVTTLLGGDGRVLARRGTLVDVGVSGIEHPRLDIGFNAEGE